MPDIAQAPEAATAAIDTTTAILGGTGGVGLFGGIAAWLFKRQDARLERVFNHTIPRLQEAFTAALEALREEMREERKTADSRLERTEQRHAEERRVLTEKYEALAREVAALRGAKHG